MLTLFVGFRARKSTAHSERFNDWKDLCLYRARDARRSGKPNRVFYLGFQSLCKTFLEGSSSEAEHQYEIVEK